MRCIHSASGGHLGASLGEFNSRFANCTVKAVRSAASRSQVQPTHLQRPKQQLCQTKALANELRCLRLAPRLFHLQARLRFAEQRPI